MAIIERLRGLEILDSRGNPTVQATCLLRGGVEAAASVPSGASVGSAEAHELRDGDPTRYRGRGCTKAVANIEQVIGPAVCGRAFGSQHELDQFLVELDGTPNKSRLGANAILAVSLAFARASALEAQVPLYEYFARMVGAVPDALPLLPMNLFSGGEHAGRQVSIQDVLILPIAFRTLDAVLTAAHAIYDAAALLIQERYGMRQLVADEGGLAPPCRNSDEMISLAVEAITRAGFTPGNEIALALDVASTHFYSEGEYALDEQNLDSAAMVEQLRDWTQKYPVVSVEDGLAEEDWESWPVLLAEIGDRACVVGDDLLCTNADRVRRAIKHHACNALLLKVNQAGTLSDAAAAYHLAIAAGWKVIVSVRSGETEDHWAADLAVGWNADQFKNGSITRSERLAKLNRLIQISRDTGWNIRNWQL